MKNNKIKITLENIGEQVNRAMFEEKIGVRKLAEKADVCPVVVYKILKGENYKIESLLKVTNTLKLKKINLKSIKKP